MITLDQARDAIGAPVTYRRSPDTAGELGVITSVSERYVHVRYRHQPDDAHGQATDPAALTFTYKAAPGQAVVPAAPAYGTATEPLPDPTAVRDTSLVPDLPGGVYYEPRPGEVRPPRTWWAASMSAPGGRSGLYVEHWGRYYEHRGNSLAPVDHLPPDAVALIPGHRPGLQPPEGYDS